MSATRWPSGMPSADHTASTSNGGVGDEPAGRVGQHRGGGVPLARVGHVQHPRLTVSDPNCTSRTVKAGAKNRGPRSSIAEVSTSSPSTGSAAANAASAARSSSPGRGACTVISCPSQVRR